METQLLNHPVARRDQLFLSNGKHAPKKLILKSNLSPGDILMLTAAIRDLHLTYPGQFITDVRTSCKELWENNPYITSLSVNDSDVDIIDCQYPLVHRSNHLPFHFIHAYIMFLNQHLGINIHPNAFKADIHLRNEEKEWISQIEEITGKSSPRFWIIVSGGKKDFTNKWWDPTRFQQVVDYFRGRIQFVQVGQEHHVHPPLEGVINLIGKTDLRQLVRLMYHADGVVCGVTMLMHLAAAVETKIGRPKNRACVVVAGGREPSQWEAYPHHQFLHTNGALPCCENGGCWKSRVQPLGDGKEQDNSLCLNPVATDNGVMLPKCLDIITSKDVIDAIELYLQYDNLSSKANPNETLNDEIINIHSDQKLAPVTRSHIEENVRGGGI
jgi:ADP-heptose:LPS heptosyltransferase